jgi:hypothetical protein
MMSDLAHSLDSSTFVKIHASSSPQQEMAELPPNDDNPGYVYAFEIRGMLAHIILRGTYRTYCCRFKLRRSDKTATEGWLHGRFTQTHGPMAEAMLHILRGHWPGGLVGPPPRHRRGDCCLCHRRPCNPGPQGTIMSPCREISALGAGGLGGQ